MSEEILIQTINGISPALLAIGTLTLCIGIFVAGIKIMFWSFYEIDGLIKRFKSKPILSAQNKPPFTHR